MTIEELKDLIDSTINENGTKAITGKALNLALNEITNAVAESATTGGGGGGGVKRLYVNMPGGSNTDPEQLASNAALYTEIVTALTNNELPSQVGMLGGGGGSYEHLIAVSISYIISNLIFCFLEGKTTISIILMSNGNASMGG